MISNNLCPYCRIVMIKGENKNNSRSVEHLIPNAVLTTKRKKDEGDFYACRSCNSRKSNIDYVLGTIAKCQNDNDELAADTLIKAVTKNNGTANKFIDMVQTAKEKNGYIHMEVPINGDELVEYINFLGKGQYFKRNHKAFNPNKYVIQPLFANKQVSKTFKEAYQKKYKSNPFTDLHKNKFSEVINDGECVIYSKNNGYMFVFHQYTVITVKVLKKNRKNILSSRRAINEILSDFN